MGEGWGFACSQCPRPGTKAFDELCPRGFGFVDQVVEEDEYFEMANDYLILDFCLRWM